MTLATKDRPPSIWPHVPHHVQAAWSRLEGNLECKGLCQESCEGWVCTEDEGAVLARVAGKPVAEGKICPFLDDGGCSVHAVRPLVCRLWGQVESMPCRFGCKPKRMIPDDEAMALAHALGPAVWSPWPEIEKRHRRMESLSATPASASGHDPTP